MKLFLFTAALLTAHVQGLVCHAGVGYYGIMVTGSKACAAGESCVFYEHGGGSYYDCLNTNQAATYQSDGYSSYCSCNADFCNTHKCGVCFDGGQKIDVKGDDGVVEEKQMKHLEIGDNVHVGNGEYNKVFAFSHKTAKDSSEMLKIHTHHGHIKLSPSHYIYANNKHIPSKEVKVGDFLHKHDGSLSEVKKIERVQSSGLYAPHTVSGNIVVNGHKASCYTTAVNPTIAHAALKPVGMLYEAGFTGAAKVMDKLMQSPTIASAARKLLGE